MRIACANIAYILKRGRSNLRLLRTSGHVTKFWWISFLQFTVTFLAALLSTKPRPVSRNSANFLGRNLVSICLSAYWMIIWLNEVMQWNVGMWGRTRNDISWGRESRKEWCHSHQFLGCASAAQSHKPIIFVALLSLLSSCLLHFRAKSLCNH